jgi:hypothetical protein
MTKQFSPSRDAAGSQPDETYAVGYCRPPRHTQFRKGHSGNGKGRRKGCRNVRAEFLEILTGPVVVTVGGKRRRVSALVALQHLLLHRALNGDYRAAQVLFKNAKEFGVLDQTEASKCSCKYILSDEYLERLSDAALKELIKVGKELEAEAAACRR